ncbi:MAG: alpha/beta hydrolase family protein [Myxococcota bacterium]
MWRRNLLVLGACLALVSGCGDADTDTDTDAVQAGPADDVGAAPSADAAGAEDTIVASDAGPSSAPDDTVASDELASAPGDPGALGDYAVGHLEVTIQDPNDPERMLPTQVWYPAESHDADALTTYVIGAMGPFELEYPSAHAQRNVAAAEGTFPFVIFSHGYGGIANQSLDLCERLASHGFVVASPAHTGNTAEDDFNGTSVPRSEAAADRIHDVTTLIDAFTSATSASELLAGHVDASKVGVTGHSFGGYTSLAAVTGHATLGLPADPRVSAIAPICPDSSEFIDAELSDVTVPVLFVGGTLDTATPIDPQITRAYDLMSSPVRIRVDVMGATHTHFANICTLGAALTEMGLARDTWEEIGAGALLEIHEETCGEDAFPIDEAIRIQTHYVVAFFRTHLLGESEWEGLLSPEYAEACEPSVEFYSEGLSADAQAPTCLGREDEEVR